MSDTDVRLDKSFGQKRAGGPRVAQSVNQAVDQSGVEAEQTFLSVNEAAAFLKVRPATIYSWVHARKIPFRKHGTRLVFSKRDLEEWSRAQAVERLQLPGETPLGITTNGPSASTEAEESRSLKTKAYRPV